MVAVQHSCHSYVYLPQGMSDARVTISGTACLLKDGDVADAKKVFLQKNPGTPFVLMFLMEVSIPSAAPWCPKRTMDHLGFLHHRLILG